MAHSEDQEPSFYQNLLPGIKCSVPSSTPQLCTAPMMGVGWPPWENLLFVCFKNCSIQLCHFSHQAVKLLLLFMLQKHFECSLSRAFCAIWLFGFFLPFFLCLAMYWLRFLQRWLKSQHLTELHRVWKSFIYLFLQTRGQKIGLYIYFWIWQLFWSSHHHSVVSYKPQSPGPTERKQNMGAPSVPVHRAEHPLFWSSYKSQFQNPLDSTDTNYNLFTK